MSGSGNISPTVDQQDAILLLDGHAVATDLAETAQEDDANGVSHR